MGGVACDYHAAPSGVEHLWYPICHLVGEHLGVIWEPECRTLEWLAERLSPLLVDCHTGQILVLEIRLRGLLPRALQLKDPCLWFFWVRNVLDSYEKPVSLGMDGVVHDWVMLTDMLGFGRIVVADVHVQRVVGDCVRFGFRFVVLEEPVASRGVCAISADKECSGRARAVNEMSCHSLGSGV